MVSNVLDPEPPSTIRLGGSLPPKPRVGSAGGPSRSRLRSRRHPGGAASEGIRKETEPEPARARPVARGDPLRNARRLPEGWSAAHRAESDLSPARGRTGSKGRRGDPPSEGLLQ